MAITPIYSWPTPDLPVSADGPAAFSTVARAIEVTVNAQATKRVFFSQQLNHTAGIGDSNIGGWASAGGFVGNAAGITAPEAGIYTVFLGGINTNRLMQDPRSGFQITIGGGARCYYPPVVPGQSGMVSTTCSYTGLILAGGQINFIFHNFEVASLIALMQLNIVKVSA